MKKLTALLLALTLLLTLTACGAGKSTAYRQEAVAETMAPAAMMDMAAGAMVPEEMQAENGAALKTNGAAGSSTLPESRKWIITVDMSVETEDLEALQAKLDHKISALNGYVENQNFYNGSSYSSYRHRSANLTVRIPADSVSQFTTEVDGIANVVSNNLRREDITLQYVATESRVKALEAEQERLLELMSQAETMSDLLEIEARLTDVRYELESYGSQLRIYDNQIDYATVYLYIEEVRKYTPVEEPTLWARITDGFKESLEGLVESLEDLLVFLIMAAPYLAVYGTLGAVLFLLIRRIRKGKPIKKQRAAEQNQKEQ